MTRKEAINILKQYKRLSFELYRYEQEDSNAFDIAIDALLANPTAGKWIVKQGNYCGVELKEFFCDKCGTRGALRRVFSDPEPLPNFCGNCGADMRVKSDNERSE